MQYPFAWLGVAAALLASTFGSDAAPRRIVSMNMCADQYLIALADPGQIAGLTRFSRDPEMSYFAARAQNMPVVTRSAEQILMLRPDLVVGVPFRQRSALAPLKAHGVRMIDVPESHGLKDIEKMIAEMADAVGHPERGRLLIAEIRTRLARIDRTAGQGRVAAYYQRRGYVTGTGTLIDDIMGRVGLVNLAARLKLSKVARVSIEQMALSRPDFLIMESATARVSDQGTELLHHPLLEEIVPPARRLYIPQALTVCGGPSYPEAVERLAALVKARR